jgi:hypothetical protein
MATLHNPDLLARLDDLAQDFAGERVIKASVLQQSWMAHHIFKGMAKQPHQAALDRLPTSAYYMVKGRALTEVSDRAQADACLIKLTHLASDPCLVDPVVTPPKGRISAWLASWISKWKDPVSEEKPVDVDTHTRETVDTASLDPELSRTIARMSVQYGGVLVIEAGELCKSGIISQLFKNQTKTPRRAVGQHLVRDRDYLVARIDKNTGSYVACEPTVSQARFLVRQQYVIDQLSGAVTNSTDAGAATAAQPSQTDSQARPTVPVIPYLQQLDLEDQEMFRDNDNGHVYQLTVRGERHPRRCFFKVADVGRMLGMLDLTSSMLNPKSTFLPEEDNVKMLLAEGKTGSPPPEKFSGGATRTRLVRSSKTPGTLSRC